MKPGISRGAGELGQADQRSKAGVARERQDLGQWIKCIAETEMPVFGQTVRYFTQAIDDEDSSASAMAQIILQDASMTARVLRLANSTFYNPSGQPISTVSRSLVILGTDVVRSICLSLSVIDALLQGGVRERAIQHMVRAFHAAVQARSLAIEGHDRFPEEVFIATLLLHLGDMAFWCFAGELGKEADAALKQGLELSEVEDGIIGFRLKQLTLGLARFWQLNGLLLDALQGKSTRRGRVQWVELGDRIAATAETKGWDSPQMRQVIQDTAIALDLSVEAVTESVHRNAEEAARAAINYGIPAEAQLILATGSSDAGNAAEELAGNAGAPAFTSPDPVLQLKVLRELSLVVGDQAGLNVLLEMVLEGMYRGIGLDRVLFALLTQDKRLLKPRFALGTSSDALLQHLTLELSRAQPGLLNDVVWGKESFWIRDATDPSLAGRVPDKLVALAGAAGFLIAPVVVNNQAIGIFYADRQPSRRPLDGESYESFKLFTHQANIGLEYKQRHMAQKS